MNYSDDDLALSPNSEGEGIQLQGKDVVALHDPVSNVLGIHTNGTLQWSIPVGNPVNLFCDALQFALDNPDVDSEAVTSKALDGDRDAERILSKLDALCPTGLDSWEDSGILWMRKSDDGDTVVGIQFLDVFDSAFVCRVDDNLRNFVEDVRAFNTNAQEL